jgi:chemotaxis protein MotB
MLTQRVRRPNRPRARAKATVVGRGARFLACAGAILRGVPEARLVQSAASMRTRYWLSLLLLGSVGCVSQGKYDEALAESQRLRENVRAVSESDAARSRELAQLKQELAKAKLTRLDLDRRLGLAEDSSAQRKRDLDDETAMNAGLRTELERLGKNVDKLLADRGTLGKALDDAKKRLDELRRAQAAAEARAALFRNLALKLKKMIDAGELSVVLRDGRMVLVLPNDVLFDSGRAKLKPAGQKALEQVAAVLVTLEGRDFQVAGHTDNEPIKVSGYQSNWALSTARALDVVALLAKAKVPETHLSAAGYGEFNPVADNASDDGRAKNRRIEITLQPRIDELVAVP